VLDREIQSLVNKEPFTIYLPQFNHSLFQILASHFLCENSVLVEEGITAYKLDKALYTNTKTGFVQFLSSIFTKRFILKNNHYHPYPLTKFKYAITLSEDGFPFIEMKKVILINREAIADYINIIVDEDLVFVLDSFKERAMISDEEYFTIIEETLNLLKSHKRRLLVKFHPEQNEVIREKTLNFISNSFKFENVVYLNDSCILELEFLKSKNLIVIGMHTSLLYYANKFGHNVLSSIKITSRYPKINNYINHIMDREQRKRYMSYE
ncbi:MAG: polysialyltransferase family glycosyltransferase, partial [Xanthomarina sp.]